MFIRDTVNCVFPIKKLKYKSCDFYLTIQQLNSMYLRNHRGILKKNHYNINFVLVKELNRCFECILLLLPAAYYFIHVCPIFSTLQYFTKIPFYGCVSPKICFLNYYYLFQLRFITNCKVHTLIFHILRIQSLEG